MQCTALRTDNKRNCLLTWCDVNLLFPAARWSLATVHILSVSTSPTARLIHRISLPPPLPVTTAGYTHDSSILLLSPKQWTQQNPTLDIFSPCFFSKINNIYSHLLTMLPLLATAGHCRWTLTLKPQWQWQVRGPTRQNRTCPASVGPSHKLLEGKHKQRGEK